MLQGLGPQLSAQPSGSATKPNTLQQQTPSEATTCRQPLQRTYGPEQARYDQQEAWAGLFLVLSRFKCAVPRRCCGALRCSFSVRFAPGRPGPWSWTVAK